MTTRLIRIRRKLSQVYLFQILYTFNEKHQHSTEDLFLLAARNAMAWHLDFYRDIGTELAANVAMFCDANMNLDEYKEFPKDLILGIDYIITRELLIDMAVFLANSLFWIEYDGYTTPNPIPIHNDIDYPYQPSIGRLIKVTGIQICILRTWAKAFIDSTTTREHPKLLWVEDDFDLTEEEREVCRDPYDWSIPIEENWW